MKKAGLCPHCGGKAEIKKAFVCLDEVRFVRCKECGCRTKFVVINHPALAIKDGEVVLDESTRYSEEEAENLAITIWNKRV